MRVNKFRTSMLLAVLLALAVGILPGIPKSPAIAEVGETEVAEPAGDAYTALESEITSIVPSVPEYTIEPDLSNVVNLDAYEEEFTPGQLGMLAQNGFVVTTSDNLQMFWIYEKNNYHDPQLPSFITTDSMLHTYHMFFDYSLRTLEEYQLLPILGQLTDAMLTASEADLADAVDPLVQEAALRNAAFFAVAKNILDGTLPPEVVEEMVLGDIEKIENHSERETSDVTGLLLDFTQFVPRGHYTRNEELGKYFKAMMWYGLSGFAIPGGNVNSIPTLQALLMTRNLETSTTDGIPAMDLWETIYEPTTFYVGKSDDYTVYDYSLLMNEVFGNSPDINEFGNEATLAEFVEKAKDLAGPGIEQYVPITAGQEDSGMITAGWRQFRFMGQRFIPDSRILQELVIPKVSGRLFPSGLDVFAALGSDRALEILRADDELSNFEGYETQMGKMRSEVEELPDDTWRSNLYYGWLWSLKSIIAPAPEGYPAFMRNSAWQDKSIFSSLGSWTELRHDTVLYAKQSGAECGGDVEEPPPPPKSYVEPNVEFWTKLQWLLEYTRDELESRGIQDRGVSYYFGRLIETVTFCREISIKELTGELVTEDEYRRMMYIGGEMEQLFLYTAGGEIMTENDRDMSLVVDIHTGMGSALEEAIGRSGVIYVIVPVEGELVLTRGPVFTQYEFIYPASDRLTNEKWHEMLDSGDAPGFAEWTSSFLSDTETVDSAAPIDPGPC